MTLGFVPRLKSSEPLVSITKLGEHTYENYMFDPFRIPLTISELDRHRPGEIIYLWSPPFLSLSQSTMANVYVSVPSYTQISR